MKKLVITIIAALVASGAFAQDSAFPDIPANHWAGDAVSRIADLGIVIGFPDGTYRGNEAFTRYQTALVISRTLDVINENIDAALAMTEEDIASLRNAVQELASDVAAQGVRLSAAESAIASISDDVTANSARIAELEDELMNAGVDPEVLRELQNQIASLRVAADTAQAQAEAAEARANDAFNRANQALAAADENASAIDALTGAVRVLQQQIEALNSAPAGPGVPAGLVDRVARNTEDIANIREFVILLRRDQVALRDRVSALESSDGEQTAAISDLQERVTALEENPLGISGEISIDYNVVRFGGTLAPFDIDRAFGYNLPRGGESFFSTGESDDDEADNEEEADYGPNIDGAGANGNLDGDVDVSAELTFNFNTEFMGTGPLGTESFSAVVELGVSDGFNGEGETDEPLGNNNEFAIELQDVRVNYDPIGAEPIVFEYGEELDESFTSYILQTDNHITVTDDTAPPPVGGVAQPSPGEVEATYSNNEGFVATVSAPDFLAFLDPTLTVLYSTEGNTSTYEDVAGNDQPFELDGYVRGVRGTLSPFDGVTGGVTFVQAGFLAADFGDLSGNNIERTVWGVDASATISVLTLNAEYASSSTTGLAGNLGGDFNGDGTAVTFTDGNDASILYVTADVDVGGLGLPIINSLSANYRSIDANWFSYGYGLDGDDDGAAFVEDQTGFGVNAGFDIFGILSLDGYFDSYSVAAGDSVSAFGVDAEAGLPLGFMLEGFYHMVSVDGTAVGDLEDALDAANAVVPAGDGLDRDDNYDTGFGVTLSHDGSGPNALINNLNLSFGYSQTGADFDTTTLEFDADYTLAISIVEITPYVGYESVTDADPNSDDTTTLEAGTGLTATIGSLPLVGETALGANVNYRNTDHADVLAGNYTSNILQYNVGVEFGAFLFGENSDLSVDYASYTGQNITANPGDFDDANTGFTSSVTGYEVVWNYYGLEFGYGVYTYDPNTAVGVTSNAQEFSISYTVTF